MRALIVDDERLARAELRRLLKAHPEIEVVGEAANARQAEDAIRALAPELIFLDVQMPGRNGFELLAQLNDPPAVIFTTAYDKYALKAFEFGAYDYLLKPIAPERLARALDRLSKRGAPPGEEDEASPASTKSLDENDQVFLKDDDRCWFVRVGDIRLLESEGNYARVYFKEHRPLIARTLQALGSRLDAQKFVRVSRKHIVNMRFVTKVEPDLDRGLLLWLTDKDPQVRIGRRRAQELRERLRL
jgi:two-component system, LytTR family, response regulator